MFHVNVSSSIEHTKVSCQILTVDFCLLQMLEVPVHETKFLHT